MISLPVRFQALITISTLRGFPPKIIWIRVGNCTTSQIEKLIRAHYETIQQMQENPTAGILLLR
ncbi:DUF5615 family PIN-like protein [Candidatus Jettenia sp. AMX1]|uniref:DUF5615 family PIN-like protein n=1 Tax=Candidatus Jettenia sp. AMX1 TaxID=2293637 RepID=UPI0033304A97